MPERQQSELSLHGALSVLRRRLGVFLLCLILVPVSALVVSLLVEKQYTASAALLFRDPALDQKLFGSSFVERSGDDAREAATNVELVSLDAVAERTATTLDGVTGKELDEDVRVEAEGQSDVVSISATVPNPELAARIANSFAAEYVAFRREADRSQIREAQRLVRADLGNLSAGERRERAGQGLRERLEQLGVLASLQTGNAELVEKAEVPDSPSSPQPVENAALGLVFGAVLGLGLVFFLDRLDRRLRDPREVEDTFQRPTLAVIPESSGLRNPDRALLSLHEGEREAFRMLRANLRYFSVSRDIRSVLITSSSSGDGKSTVSWHLAAAAATAGSRVLIVEADLRHPTLGERYGLGSRWGLTSVLTGEVDFGAAVQVVPLHTAASAASSHQLHVLLAGALPPNPTDLMESKQMTDVLRAAEADYDFVVIDTPPTVIVSDAIPLLRLVGGVIAVSRLGKTTRDSALQLRHQLEHLEAPMLGVVVNSVDRGGSYGYGYGYGYGYAPASGSAPSPTGSGGQRGGLPRKESTGQSVEADPPQQATSTNFATSVGVNETAGGHRPDRCG